MVQNEMTESNETSGLQNAISNGWISKLAVPRVDTTGPLAGLKFGVKDNIDVAGVPTTAACPAFAFKPTADAASVSRLMAAGAALVGKTNLDQFACGLNGTRSPYGAVPNAFDPAYVSGGSSSGSAYVVAIGEVDFALGTDTAGSGRVPAGLNNIVGVKPSRGLISARGVLPAAQSCDCVSIFARTVPTAMKVLHAATGYDPLDPYSRKLVLKPVVPQATFRFGVPSELKFFGDELASAAFADAVARLQSLGGKPVVIDYTPLDDAATLLYESALVAERYSAIRTFFDAHEEQVMEPVRSIVGKGRDYTAADLHEAQIRLRALGQQAAAMWDDIDVLVVPTAPTHYRIDAMRADPVVLNRNLGAYTTFVNLLDYAAISVPSAMRPDGLPFGITLIGQCATDLQLADLGERFHRATGLTQGATGVPLPAAEVAGGTTNAAPATHMNVAVVGAHLSGMPLNGQLTDRGARLVEATRTSPSYRLYALPGTTPPKPGLQRVADGGASIALEIWSMPIEHVGSFLALIPPPLGLGSVELADGSWVNGFICEGHALLQAEDVTAHGGWRAYIASLNASRNASDNASRSPA
ncbi:allophanate hydrolase [soil metagenome]